MGQFQFGAILFWHSFQIGSVPLWECSDSYYRLGDVGYVPEVGHGGGNQSVFAIKYIQWLMKQDPSLDIQYTLSEQGEKVFHIDGTTVRVDGYNAATKEVFEVHGCLYHGCPQCHPHREEPSVIRKDVTVGCLHDNTMKREKILAAAGYKVRPFWECQINKQLSRDSEMRRFFDLNRYTARLAPRTALYGGRTQCFKATAKSTDNVQLEYWDFVSMYPYLNAGGAEYPRGNAKIITGNFPKTSEKLKVKGLVYCDVLPPVHARLGVLPQKVSGKLMFPLCRTCAESGAVKEGCRHKKVSERYLTGTWYTEELNKAMEYGYKVLRYHEMWVWDDWMRGGYFAEYIRPLLKMKHEASGCPSDVVTDEQKVAYVKWIKEHDHVELDPLKINVNPALRSLAKLFLNSAWGKFAQNPVKTETRLIWKKDADTLTNFMDDPAYEPTALVDVGKHKVIISRKPKVLTVKGAPFTNLAIGIITTASTRLRLLEAMERVGVDNLIYCVTDSLIFKRNRGEEPLGDLKGKQLGFLTDEIKKGKLKEVVVMAPKVYALKIEDGNGKVTHSVKAKGLKLSSANALKVNFDTMQKAMKDFIADGVAEPLEGEMMTFRRGDHALDGLWTRIGAKCLRPTMDKGHFDEEGVVTPFGLLPPNTILINDYPF